MQVLARCPIIDFTGKTKEKHYIKKKIQLYTKSNNLKNATIKKINNTTPEKKVINEGVKFYWEWAKN